MIKRPMLAAPASRLDIERLQYPLLASPKLDGIRVVVHPELGAVTRKFKQVPNRAIYEALSCPEFYGLDGEIMCRTAGGKLATFNEIQSCVMSRSGSPSWEYWVFDYTDLNAPFNERYRHTAEHVVKLRDPRIKIVPQSIVEDPDQLLEMASKYIACGYEGIMMRDPTGPYKEGRSTLRQQWLVKYKEFSDATGIITGVEPLEHNTNVAELDELGYTKRSHMKGGKQVSETMMGKLVVDTEWGELRIGTGFDFALREHIWTNREEYIGKHVDFRFQSFGVQNKPRFPSFLRFRKEFD